MDIKSTFVIALILSLICTTSCGKSTHARSDPKAEQEQPVEDDEESEEVEICDKRLIKYEDPENGVVCYSSAWSNVLSCVVVR